MSTVDQAAISPLASEISVNRRILRTIVSATLLEAGFNTATEDAIETLSEMLSSFLAELCRSSKALCDYSGRTEPLVTDVILALVEMGINIQSLPSYGKRTTKVIIPPPSSNPSAMEPKRLQLGTQPQRPAHIPENMPEFPDAHCFIRTMTHAAPATGYQNIREKSATSKREVAKALTKFIAKTGDTENLFPDDPYAFALIADKPKPMPYLDSALSKKWEESEAGDEESDKWTDQHLQQQQVQYDKDKSESHKLDRSDSFISAMGSVRTDAGIGGGGLESLDADSLIDNPFLRPIKMPRMKSGSKKYKF